MEKRFTFFGASAKAALVAVLVLGLVLVGCDSGDDPNGGLVTVGPGSNSDPSPSTPVDLSGKTSVADIEAAIASAKAAGKISGTGAAGDPHVVKAAGVDVSNTATLGNLYTGIAGALTGDISLDLSDCTASTGSIGYTNAATATVKQRFVAITLPDAVTAISNGVGIYTGAFSGFTKLKSIDAPKVVTVGNYAFSTCSALTTVSLPAATTFGDSTFLGCSALITVNLPAATTFFNQTFYGCIALTTVNLPVAATLASSMFSGCIALTTVNLPVATTFSSYTFRGCTVLNTVILGNAPPTVGTHSFLTISSAQAITVKVPVGSVSAYNATWQQAFRGVGGNASAANGSGAENTAITLTIMGI